MSASVPMEPTTAPAASTASASTEASTSYGEPAAPLDVRKVAQLAWGLAIAGAVTSVVLGILMLVWPDATLLVGAVLFGIWLVVHGIVDIVQAFTEREADGVERAFYAIVGVLFLVGGVVCLRNLTVSLLTIATIIGITWLIGGLVALITAFGSRFSGTTRWVAGLLGAVSIVGGLVVLVWPDMSLLTLVYITGIWLILMGIVQFVMALRLRSSV